MFTKCQNCVFAIIQPNYQDQPEQIGCELNRLEKFLENGEEVTLNEDGTYTIGRVCMTKRLLPWGENLSSEERAKLVRQEITLKCSVLLYVGTTNSEVDVQRSLDSLKQQTLPFGVIHIINNSPYLRKGQLITLLRNYDEKVAWMLHSICDTDENGVLKDRANALNIHAGDIIEPFVLVADAGITIENIELLAQIDRAINDELKRFVVLKLNNGYITVSDAFYSLQGEMECQVEGENNITGFINKINYMAQQSNERAVFELAEIV